MSIAPEALPTPKMEAWKYTNLQRVMPQGLVRAELEEEIVIHRTRGQNGGKAEEILWSGRDGLLHMPRLKLVLEEGAEFTLIERHEGEGAYWKNMDVAIEIGAGARLNHIRVFDDAAEAVHTSDMRIVQESGSSYNGFYVMQNSRLIRNEVGVELLGEGAACYLSGINVLRDVQHGDTTITVEHKAPHCISNQFFRSILCDQARGVFQGKIHVHEGAQKTEAYQLSNALLLSEGAEMDTKPELEIYADDVKCTHGATTGQLDEEPLFYLRSRGIPEDVARGLLTEAFLNEVIEKIPDEGFREVCLQQVPVW